MIGIYKVKNIIENKIYIGQSKDLEKRKRNFFNFGTKRYGGRLIDTKRQEYNKSEFWEYNILSTCNENDLNKLEQFFIKQYNSNVFENGYNISAGGKGNCGIKLSNETKAKISLKLKGRKFTDEHKIKMRGPRNLPKRKNGKVVINDETLAIYSNAPAFKNNQVLADKKAQLEAIKKDYLIIYMHINAARATNILQKEEYCCYKEKNMYVLPKEKLLNRIENVRSQADIEVNVSGSSYFKAASDIIRAIHRFYGVAKTKK